MTLPAAGHDRVAEALPGWLAELAATGGPTGLLHCPDGGSGALELTTAHPSGLAQLLAGRPARLSSLVREPAAFADAHRRAREVHARAEELREQHGLEAAHLAVGVATWTPPAGAERGGPPLRAPVLLRRCGLRPVGAVRDDYELHLAPGVVLNPVLLQHLAVEHGTVLDATAIAASAVGGRGFDPVPAYATLTARLAQVPGFRIERRLLLGTFADPGTAAARDVAELAQRLREHPVLALLAPAPAAPEDAPAAPGEDGSADAGAPDAGAPVAQAAPPAQAPVPPAAQPPAAGPDPSPLLLDLDPEQREAVDRALDGDVLTSIEAPTGTGATQVAAALVATLAARGRRTLLLADAAEELRAVDERIAATGAGRLVLHVRDAGGAEDVEHQLVAARERVRAATAAPPPVPGDGGARAEQHRRALEEHLLAQHRPREPWGVSASAAREALAELAEHPGRRTTRRLRGEALARCRQEDLPAWAERLAEAAELGAFSVTPGTTPWAGARLTTDEEAEATARSVRHLVEDLLPAARARMAALDEEAGLRGADTVSGWAGQLRLLQGVRGSVARFGPDVFRQSLSDVALATGSPELRREQGARMGWWRAWQLRRQARAMVLDGVAPDGTAQLHEWLQSARAQRLAWQRASGRGGIPHVPAGLAAAEEALQALQAELDAVAAVLPERCGGPDGVRELPLPQLAALLRSLRDDDAALGPLPRRTVLLQELVEGGWQPLLEDVGARWGGPGSVDLLAEVRTAWWAGVLEAISLADHLVGAVDSAHLRQVRADYCLADRAAVAAAAAEVRTAVQQRAREALQAGGPAPDGARPVRGAPPRPVADVLRAWGEPAGALLPCWAMSTLAVPEAVPAEADVDVVIVLGGERTALPALLPGLARARRLVVVGDRALPPPLPFATVAPAPADAGTAAPGRSARSAGRAPAPRVPPALEALVPQAPAVSVAALADAALRGGGVRLRRQHACRDLRLLLPQAAGGSPWTGPPQVVVPGAGGADVLRVLEADPRAGGRGASSLAEEVAAVVAEHVRRWPRQSLGVVVPDAGLARELDEAVRRRLAAEFDLPARPPAGTEVLLPWPPPGTEALQVAEVEQWRGVRRDAVVLVVPAGAAAQEPGASSPLAATTAGVPRVLLAATRARVRLTVVAEPLPPAEAAHAPAERLLREALEHWRSVAGGPPAAAAPVGALVRRLARACTDLGLPVVTGAGAGRPVDLLVGEAAGQEDGGTPAGSWRRGVLAVELDGAAWAGERGVRERERGRPQSLERAGWRYVRSAGSDVLGDPEEEARRLAQLWRDEVEGALREVGR